MSDAPEMRPTLINQRWTLNLPVHRATRPLWDHWERDALHSLWCHIRPGDVVWDIGAEEGDLSALYASWGAQVVCVEPSPQAWPWIKATFEANGLPEPLLSYRALVGRTGNDAPWFFGRYPPEADGEFVPDHGFRHLDEALDSEPCVTLDQIGERYFDAPAVVVMDIEGAEYQALLGAEKLLARRQTTFAISVHPEFMRARWNDTPDDLLVLMELAGYECRYLNFDHEAHWYFKARP